MNIKAILVFLMFSAGIQAAEPELKLEIRNHLFYPSTLEIPSDKKVRILIINHDRSAEEFESYELNREKIIPGNSRTVIHVGPLSPGKYPFFGEFNPRTAQGQVLVR